MSKRFRFIASTLALGVLMGTAALVAGWGTHRWPSNRPLPSVGGTSTLVGTPLAPDELGPGWRFVVEIAFGAVLSNPSSTWSWTDVTSDVLQSDGRYVNISQLGRQDENPRTPPAVCSFALNNTGNKYSKNNPLGLNWPNVKDNTPVRVRLTADNGANWWVFFQGEATVWQPSWDVTGNFSIVDLSAKGRMQRLLQHTAPIGSALYHTISKESPAPIAYWSLEDGSNATSAASWKTTLPALIQTTGYALPTFSSVSSVPGSQSIPDFTDGANMRGQISGITSTTNGYTVEFVVAVGSTLPSTAPTVFQFDSPNEGLVFIIKSDTSAWRLFYQPTDGTPGTTYDFSWASTFNPYTNQPALIQIALKQVGADTQIGLTISNETQRFTFTETQTGRTMGIIKYVLVGTAVAVSPGVVGIGHVSVWNGYLSPDAHYSAMNGYSGETPVTRMTRLCSEEGIEFQQVGTYVNTITMGPQKVDTFTNLMQECADAEDGMLYDGVSAGLTYQPPSQRYDQSAAITLDTTAHETQVFQPIDDDLMRVNRATVTQKDGSTSVAEQVSGPMGTGPNGMGNVDSQLTINVDQSRFAAYRASWEVWKGAGSDAGFRFPLIPLNLRAHPTTAAKWIARTDGFSGPVVPGSRLDLLNVSTWAPQFPPGTVSVVIEGYAIRLTNLMFEIDLLCTPNRRYDVIKVADSQLGRVQTAGALLAGDTPAGGTTLSVATQAGSVAWVTGAVSFYVDVDGIKVSVTNIGSGTTDSQGRTVQTFTVSGATVTKPLLTGAYVKVWHGGVVKY